MPRKCKRCEHLGARIVELALRFRLPSKSVWCYAATALDIDVATRRYVEDLAGLRILTEPFTHVAKAVRGGATHVIVRGRTSSHAKTLCGIEIVDPFYRIVFRRDLRRRVTCKRCLAYAEKETPRKLEDMLWYNKRLRKLLLGRKR